MVTKSMILAAATWILVCATAHAQEPPRFSREVAAVFSKLGCNSGACHGAVNGQNGFRLTLFGANPEIDHERLLREIGGRRVNFQTPEASLVLLTATGETSLGGGKRAWKVGSPEHVLVRWIAAGARLDAVEKSHSSRSRSRPPSGSPSRVKLTASRSKPRSRTARPRMSRRCAATSGVSDRHVANCRSRTGQVEVQGGQRCSNCWSPFR